MWVGSINVHGSGIIIPTELNPVGLGFHSILDSNPTRPTPTGSAQNKDGSNFLGATSAGDNNNY